MIRPTLRSFVAVGSTAPSAERTSSIRVTGVAIPRPTVPDIEPEASNTIMASSLQGVFGSAASAAAPKATIMPKEIGANRPKDINETTPARHTHCN